MNIYDLPTKKKVNNWSLWVPEQEKLAREWIVKYPECAFKEWGY